MSAVHPFFSCFAPLALLHTSTTSGVVQVLLTCLAKVAPKTFRSLSRDVVQALTEEEEDATEELLESEPAARIVEAILANAEKCPKLHRKLAKLLFDGRLLRWSKHPVGNFSVQRLLDSCGDKKEVQPFTLMWQVSGIQKNTVLFVLLQFEKWFEEELDSGMEDIFTSGNTGVILSIAKASRRLSTKQSHFLVVRFALTFSKENFRFSSICPSPPPTTATLAQALMRTLHCYEPSHHQPKLVPLLVRLATRESSEGDDEGVSVHLHGSLILQELLSFNKPIKVVSSLLGLPSGRLRALLSDPRGCHVSDAFMMSPTIGEKSREGFAKALKVRGADVSSEGLGVFISHFRIFYLFFSCNSFGRLTKKIMRCLVSHCRESCFNWPVQSMARDPWTPFGSKVP